MDESNLTALLTEQKEQQMKVIIAHVMATQIQSVFRMYKVRKEFEAYQSALQQASGVPLPSLAITHTVPPKQEDKLDASIENIII